MKKIIGLSLFLALALPVFAGNPAVERDPIKPSLIDTTASWYVSGRIYYEPNDGIYTGGDFFDALDLPAMFGLGFLPIQGVSGKTNSMTLNSQLLLEWRHFRTYSWYVMLGMDTHDHDFENIQFPADKKGFVSNAVSGTVFNMDILLGLGYRIPLVPDIKDYYEHPYISKFNLGLGVQLGPEISKLFDVKLADSYTAIGMERYDVGRKTYVHPVMKLSANFEWFLSKQFNIIVGLSYLQHLQAQPWDNNTTCMGMFSPSVGLCTFF